MLASRGRGGSSDEMLIVIGTMGIDVTSGGGGGGEGGRMSVCTRDGESLREEAEADATSMIDSCSSAAIVLGSQSLSSSSSTSESESQSRSKDMSASSSSSDSVASISESTGDEDPGLAVKEDGV